MTNLCILSGRHFAFPSDLVHINNIQGDSNTCRGALQSRCWCTMGELQTHSWTQQMHPWMELPQSNQWKFLSWIWKQHQEKHSPRFTPASWYPYVDGKMGYLRGLCGVDFRNLCLICVTTRSQQLPLCLPLLQLQLSLNPREALSRQYPLLLYGFSLLLNSNLLLLDLISTFFLNLWWVFILYL